MHSTHQRWSFEIWVWYREKNNKFVRFVQQSFNRIFYEDSNAGHCHRKEFICWTITGVSSRRGTGGKCLILPCITRTQVYSPMCTGIWQLYEWPRVLCHPKWAQLKTNQATQKWIGRCSFFFFFCFPYFNFLQLFLVRKKNLFTKTKENLKRLLEIRMSLKNYCGDPCNAFFTYRH